MRVTIRWDVALDRHRVRYVAYYQDHPFDFTADPHLLTATRVELVPRIGVGYVDGVGPGRFPYEADLSPLVPGVAYAIIVRAIDGSPAANQDANQHVLSATPTLP